jgi:hypothetical protein
MTDAADPATELQQLLLSAASGQLLLAVFSGPTPAAAPHIRVDVRPVRLKGQPALQFAARSTPISTRTLPPPDCCSWLMDASAISESLPATAKLRPSLRKLDTGNYTVNAAHNQFSPPKTTSCRSMTVIATT